MLKGLNPEFMRELKYKNDLVEVASGYLTLERKGANHWACCPFHHEKTPSFSINGAEGFYHCFGCGVSGDVVKFVQEIETVDFFEAVRILANRAKMPMPESDFDTEETVRRKKKKDNMLNIMLESARFYRKNLYSPHAVEHVRYIRNRRMDEQTVKKFGLGASLDFFSLPDYLAGRGFTKEDLLDSGALMESKGRLLDAQGGRLIFPIINYMDEVVAFGGRILEKKDFAKYKNTKETQLFNKSKTLYNINLLKKQKKSAPIPSVIIVEGYMDTISLYQAGFKNVVASMGTALTQDQIRLIKRYSPNVLISYDGDFAGQKANSRGLELLKGEGMNVKVVPLPEGADPDDVVRQSKDAYQDCLNKAMPLIDYKLLYAARGKDLTKPEEKRSYIQTALSIIREADSESEKEDLLRTLRDKTNVTYESLRRDLENSQSVSVETEAPPKKDDTAGLVEKAERFVLACALFGSDFAADFCPGTVVFENEAHRQIAEYLEDCQIDGTKPRPSALFDLFDDDTPEVDEILNLNYGDMLHGANGKRYFDDCLRVLLREKITKQIRTLADACKACTDIEERKLLMQEIQSCTEALYHL